MGSDRSRLRWLVAIALFAALHLVSVDLARVVAQPTTPTAGTSVAPLDEFLLRATDLEEREQWQQAADIYERALRFYPGSDDLEHRWERAERLSSLTRRYHDSSFKGELLELEFGQSIELYREVVSKIETHYVTEVALADLVVRGHRNLRFALHQPIFVEAAFEPGTTPQRLQELERRLGERPIRDVESVRAAANEVLWAVRVCQASGLARPSSVVLEFVSAACEGLDPYSTHLSPNRLRDLYATIDGNFVGLGVEVRGCNEGLRIDSVLPESPAEAVGLVGGSTIVAIDGVTITGQPAEEAANRLQGPENSRVWLRVRRPDGQYWTVSVVRRPVVVHSVVDVMLTDDRSGIGYVRIDSFQKQTSEELESAIHALRQKGMRSLIIDLRDNPGGLLEVALKVANQFIGEGVLVSTRGRRWGQSWSHRARAAAQWDFPLAVLIDGNSASASEILAAAVQDHHRGVLVGTRSFGKGSVQSIFPLSSIEGNGLRLTTAYFFSPDGDRLQKVGVEPDIRVSRAIGPLGLEDPVPLPIDPKADIQLRAAIDALRTDAISQR